MICRATCRWVFRSLLETPLVIGAWVMLLFAVPLTHAVQPLPGPGGILETALAWVHPAGVLGTLMGIACFAGGRDLLRRLDARKRWEGELAGLGLAAVYLQAPILAGALLSGLQPADLWRALPGILSADLHLAGIALVTLLPVLSVPAAVGLFLAATWWAPALAAAAGGGRALTLLDAAAVLRPRPFEFEPLALAPGVCLVLASLLARSAADRASSA